MDLQNKSLFELRDLARKLGVPTPAALTKKELIKEIAVYKEQAEKTSKTATETPPTATDL